MESRMTITMNAQEEICAVQKAGGSPLSTSQILECTRITLVKVQERDRWIKENLQRDSDVRSGKNPSAQGTTVLLSKQEQWESIYQKDQDSKAPPSLSQQPLDANLALENDAKVNDSSDEEMEESVPSSAIKKESSASLFAGGSSAWEQQGTLHACHVLPLTGPEGEDPSYVEVKPVESDSEEEETVILSSTLPDTKTKPPHKPQAPAGDLSAALKAKPSKRKAKR
jgi:hypothetical protein